MCLPIVSSVANQKQRGWGYTCRLVPKLPAPGRRRKSRRSPAEAGVHCCLISLLCCLGSGLSLPSHFSPWWFYSPASDPSPKCLPAS